MRSAGRTISIAAGVPILCWVLLYLTPPSGDTAYTVLRILVFGLMLGSLGSLPVLLPAAWRWHLARRGRRRGSAKELAAWIQRQRLAVMVGFRVMVAIAVVFGLVVVVYLAVETRLPGDHGVEISLPEEVEWATLTIRDVNPYECQRDQKFLLKTSSGSRAAVFSSDGSKYLAVQSFRYGQHFCVPLTWERNSSSCYVEVPSIFSAEGEVPVQIFLRVAGSAADSVPPPSRIVNTYWGWRCRAVVYGDRCDIVAVTNADPDRAVVGLGLVLGGALLAFAFSLIGGSGTLVFRAWRNDIAAGHARVGNLLRVVSTSSRKGRRAVLQSPLVDFEIDEAN